MEITGMNKDGDYYIKSGMYKGFLVSRETSEYETRYTLVSHKTVADNVNKLHLRVFKKEGEKLSEEDITQSLLSRMVNDTTRGSFESLPAAPKNFWFKKNLPELLRAEFRMQYPKGYDFGESFEALCGVMDMVKSSSTPEPYEKPTSREL